MSTTAPPSDVRFTIVIPYFDREGWLSASLESVLRQTCSLWRAIVVDDGSPGLGARAIVEGCRDPRIGYVRHDRNRGLAAARNTGIRRARTDFIVPLDSDDLLHTAYLEQVARALRLKSDADCVFTDLELFGSRSGVFRFGVRDVAWMTREQWIPGAGAAFRRRLWERVGGYCEAEELRIGNEDWDFWLAAMEHGVEAIHIEHPLYLYRQHGQSMSKGLAYADHVTREFIYRRHRALFDRHGTGHAFRAEGYLNSVHAALSRGERFRALRLAFRAARFPSHRRAALTCAARTVLPGSVSQHATAEVPRIGRAS